MDKNENKKVESANEPIISDTEMKMPEYAVETESEKSSSALGLILAILIVVLVLILGGLYLWGTTLNDSTLEATPLERPTAEENNEPESTTAKANVQAIETVSTSDELEAIEADIESTNLDELDAEMAAIEAELEASAQ